jgi:hypothetical protein
LNLLLKVCEGLILFVLVVKGREVPSLNFECLQILYILL